MTAETILDELIALSHQLGREDRQLAILGEGNTSAAIGDGSFWVKASGSYLGNIDAGGFSRVRLDKVLAPLQTGSLTDEQVASLLQNALVDPATRKPSVETFLHALCLAETGAKWVAHTHPISVNSILCSRAGAEPFRTHLFPDEIVLCGSEPAILPYTDPGLALAAALKDELHRYFDRRGVYPRIILMVNHGLVALGQTAKEALSITLMADKWARILLGTTVLGGPAPLTGAQVERIESRLDERYRRKTISQ